MSVFYYFWKIWLRINKSGKEIVTGYPPELSTRNMVKGNNDIAERLYKEGVDVSYGTLTFIIDQYDRIVRDMICEGYTVKTNNVYFTPELSGDWTMDSLVFDPQRHKCSLKCIPSDEMSRAMSFVGVRVLGFKDVLSISRVVDVVSGEVNSVITRNGNIIIEGSGIKVMANDGTTANCVFLMKENREMVNISNGILTNSENQIVVRIPSKLEIGKYRLFIYTYCPERTGKKDTYCRCIELEEVLTVR